MGAKGSQIPELPLPSDISGGSSKMDRGLCIEFLLANDEIPKCFLCLWSLDKHSGGKYGTEAKIVFVGTDPYSHWLCCLLAG